MNQVKRQRVLFGEHPNSSWKYVVTATDYDSLQRQLDVSEARSAELLAASKEMLRIAGIANQGSNAYNRAIVHLHGVVEKAAPAANEQAIDPSAPENRYTVDGAVYPNDPEGPLFQGDGQYPPFVIFDVTAQENLPKQYPTREAAETALLLLVKAKP